MSRFLVTGATGFLGSHLVAALLQAKHEVVALVRRDPAKGSANGSANGSPQQQIHYHVGDILDRASLEGAFQGCDAVFHCAGLVSRDPLDADKLHRIHVEGTRNVLEMGRAAGVRRAIVASTSGVVAVSENASKIRDESHSAPLEIIGAWPYYRTKWFAELAAFETRAPGFEVVCVNPTLLLGPGDLRGSSTRDVADILEGRLLAIPGGGLSFVDVRDAAMAMIAAWERGTDGSRYLVAAQNLTLVDFAKKISRIAGVKLPMLHLPSNRKMASLAAELLVQLRGISDMVPKVDRVTLEMAQVFWYVDPKRAIDELGWTFRDPMTTLADTIEDLERRGVVWPRPVGDLPDAHSRAVD